METNKIEWGAEIETPGNAMPDWLETGTEMRNTNYYGEWNYGSARADPNYGWEHIGKIRLRADHPYYRGDIWPDISTEDAIKIIEARGYTVTPPDPMIKDREFVAGLFDAGNMRASGSSARSGNMDTITARFMAYLRANKDKI